MYIDDTTDGSLVGTNTCGTNWMGGLGDVQMSPTNLVQLRHALHEEWDNIPIARINILMNSMHRQIKAVLRQKCRVIVKRGLFFAQSALKID